MRQLRKISPVAQARRRRRRRRRSRRKSRAKVQRAKSTPRRMLELDHPGILRTELPFPEEGARLRLSFISVRRDVKNRLTLTRVHPKDGRNRRGPDDGGRATVKKVGIDDKYKRERRDRSVTHRLNHINSVRSQVQLKDSRQSLMRVVLFLIPIMIMIRRKVIFQE